MFIIPGCVAGVFVFYYHFNLHPENFRNRGPSVSSIDRWAVDNSRFERAGRMDCESISFASNNLEIDARQSGIARLLYWGSELRRGWSISIIGELL